jgi:hypothetical protein
MPMPHQQEVRASLGCGTLLLIALIVLIFGGHQDHDQLENRVEELKREIHSLRQDIHSLRNAAPPPAAEEE